MDKTGKLSRRAVVAGVTLALGHAGAVKAQAPGQKKPAVPQIRRPGVYVKELPAQRPPIAQAEMSTLILVDRFGANHDSVITSMADFNLALASASPHPEAREQAQLFFDNGGQRLSLINTSTDDFQGLSAAIATLGARLRETGAGLVAIPAAARRSAAEANAAYGAALSQVNARHAMLLADAPAPNGACFDPQQLIDWKTSLGVSDADAALYAPRLSSPRLTESVGASGAVAGVIARTDSRRGVWKAPAGTEASIRGASPVQIATNAQQGIVNPQGVNLIRQLSGAGTVVWGSRTMSSDPEWKYVPVRRLTMMIEKSIRQGAQWTVFEPNAEPLWSSVRASVEAFFNSLFRSGAFAGSSANEAYFVRCDRTTMTQTDINAGRVIVHAGFAPLKPAEFIVRKIELRAQT